MAVTTKELDLYKEKEEEGFESMSIVTHLEELRNKLVYSFIAVAVCSLLGFYLSKYAIFLLTQIAPEGTTFLQIKPGEFFFTSIRVSLYLGLVFSSPIVISQLSGFITPGLKKKERDIIVPIFIGAPLLFITGSIFAYYFVAPSMLRFLFGFGKDVISMSISIESFVSFMLMIMAICGFAFLLPVIIYALANVGIVDSGFLVSKWRYAVLSSVVLGAVLTPTPDPFNMSLISGILIILYFVSVGSLKLINK